MGRERKLLGYLPVWIFCLGALVLSGCTGKREPETSAQTQSLPEASKPAYDYRNRVAARAKNPAKGEELKLAAYDPYELPEDDASSQYLDTWVNGDRLLAKVTRVYGENGEIKYFLFSMDGATGEKEFSEWSRSAMKGFDGDSSFLGFKGDTVFLQVHEFEEDAEDGKYLLKSSCGVHVDRSGQELGRTELIAGYLETEAVRKEEFLSIPSEVLADPAGYYYLFNLDRNKLLQIYGEGQVRLVEDHSDQKSTYFATGYDWESAPLFTVHDRGSDQWDFFWVDGESGQRKDFGSIPYQGDLILNFYLSDRGSCYYITSKNEIFRWDLTSGRQEKVYDLSEAGLGGGSAVMRMWLAENGDLHLYTGRGEDLCMIALNGQGTGAETTLTVWAADPGLTDLKAAAAVFSRKHPGVNVEFLDVNTDWRERETEFARLGAQVVSSEIPDLLYLRPNEMDTLWERSVLSDMSGFFPEEYRKDLLANLWECGARDGGQAGLCVAFNTPCLLTGKVTWDQGVWNIMDIVEILEQDRVGALLAVYSKEDEENRLQVLRELLFMSGLKNTPFLDMESRKANFNGEEFKRLLRQIKRYKNKVYEYTADGYGGLAAGECLCMWTFMNTVVSYSNCMAGMKDSCNQVGYPDGESGHYYQPQRFLCVGAGTTKGELVREFLTYYLETGGADLRESALRERVSLDYEGRWGYSAADGIFYIMNKKPDGGNYLEEYLEWMKAITPQPQRQEEIELIIEEEADKYFQDGQDLDRTCELIQNRVQLYLNES